MIKEDQVAFSSIPIEQLYGELNTSSRGLTESQASERVKLQLKFFEKESRLRRQLKLLIRQFANPLVLLLVIAVILSASLGESSDALIILFILLTSGILGYLQESNAGNAFEELNKLIDLKHNVLRENCALQVPVREIVPGDMLLLEAGDIIPADCRIVDSNELHVNESSLTGESFPVEKIKGKIAESMPLNQKSNCLWQGTNVVSGMATALVIRTGAQTIFGQMAHSLTQTPETAFEKGIRGFGYFLLRITVILAIVILLVNVYFKKPFFESILFSLALAVGMAPELLPAIMTLAMSAGARRMMRKKVIVKRLSSIFNFGEVDVLCTDKTGTLTGGNVCIKDITDIDGKSSDSLRFYAWLNASLQNGFKNPIDEAISSMNQSLQGYEKINEVPYDFIRKRLSVAVSNRQQSMIITKGAFSNIAEVCTTLHTEKGVQAIDETLRMLMDQKYVAYCHSGYRVLGLACKDFQGDKMSRSDEKEMLFLGFILLEDPLKESAGNSIHRLEQLHIHVKIITGDNRYSAIRAAQNIGIKNPVVLTGDEIDRQYPEALVVKALQTDVFAEIEPHQKEAIIKSLQKSNLTVAYMGDGINDVSAINAADIGISTNNAVDVAKQAADFVLLEKDLSVLADGVYEGRRSFFNSMKYIFINTSAIFGNMFSVAGASVLLPFLPMLPKQILLNNLLSDFPYLAIASDKVDDEQLSRPGKWDLKMIRRFMIVFGLHSSIFDFITFYILYVFFHLADASFQTGWFLESVVTQLLILYVIRTQKSFIRSRPGRLLLLASLAAIAVAILLPLSPLSGVLGFSPVTLRQFLALLIILVSYVCSADLLKLLFFRRYKPKDKSTNSVMAAI
ncbi:MAG: magnesium-translocating P-type ATPase [Chitinophagaceae bacterium]